MGDANVLEKINIMAQQKNYVLTNHAMEKAIERYWNDDDIEDILLNPIRIVRQDGPHKYKIQGGKKHRTLAVAIEECLVVITLM